MSDSSGFLVLIFLVLLGIYSRPGDMQTYSGAELVPECSNLTVCPLKRVATYQVTINQSTSAVSYAFSPVDSGLATVYGKLTDCTIIDGASFECGNGYRHGGEFYVEGYGYLSTSWVLSKLAIALPINFNFATFLNRWIY